MIRFSSRFIGYLCFFFLFFLIIFFFWYILLFYQPTSVKVVDEIKFKTIIPASSLVIRDHCWLTDGMSLFSSFPISFSQFIYLFCLCFVANTPCPWNSTAVVVCCYPMQRFLEVPQAFLRYTKPQRAFEWEATSYCVLYGKHSFRCVFVYFLQLKARVSRRLGIAVILMSRARK